MKESPSSELCIRLMTEHQGRLFGYLMTLLGNVHDARDVLQETNLVVWRKFEDYEPGTDFGAWARKCAYFQALAYLRDKKRDQHLFDEELLEQLADDPAPQDDPEARHLALRDCLAQLPDAQRHLIANRYTLGDAVRDLAAQAGRSESAIKMQLMRIRQRLLKCVESKLVEEGQ